jgi:polyisoprenoid-binding protein YceI
MKSIYQSAAIVLILHLFFFSNQTSGNLIEVQPVTSKINVAVWKQFTNSPALNATKKKSDQIPIWTINQQASKVNFTIKNFGSEVHGTLGDLKATIHFDERDPKRSSFEASVKVSTISTGITKRDKDLMKPKYFDEAKYPEITFHSDSVTTSGNGYKTVGMLTIKGKSIRKEIPFTFELKGNSRIFKSQFTLQRLDFGIGGSGPIMGKDVNVSLEVVAEKQ